MNQNWSKKFEFDRIYLPAYDNTESESCGQPFDEQIHKYREREFPYTTENGNKSLRYSIPKSFVANGQRQGAEAERISHERLSALQLPDGVEGTLWQVLFQGIAYAGTTHTKDGRLINREHDFVLFSRFSDKYFVSLIEVKSSCDSLEAVGVKLSSESVKVTKTSNIKDNKRQGKNQLGVHLQIIECATAISKVEINTFLFWPFLTANTIDPKEKNITRWKEEKGLHVFTDTLSDQKAFDVWFYENVLKNEITMEKEHFDKLFHRYIVLSCGILINEFDEAMVALLTPEQEEVLHSSPKANARPTLICGGAGTGKTLLILHRMKFWFERGLLNDKNRAIYMSQFSPLRCDFRQRLKKTNFNKHVDVKEWIDDLVPIKSEYAHIYIDDVFINFKFSKRIATHYRRKLDDRNGEMIDNYRKAYNSSGDYGDYWYAFNPNQTALYAYTYPDNYDKRVLAFYKHLLAPDYTLSKAVRNPKAICDFTQDILQFYKCTNELYKSGHEIGPAILNSIVGHEVNGAFLYWIKSDKFALPVCDDIAMYENTFNALVKGIVDMKSAKGIDPCDVCVGLFIKHQTDPNDYLTNINKAIDSLFTPSDYKPIVATENLEDFILKSNKNAFFWTSCIGDLTGLEFKVVIMVIEESIDLIIECYNIYLLASRCTCLLILVSSEKVKNELPFFVKFREYVFD